MFALFKRKLHQEDYETFARRLRTLEERTLALEANEAVFRNKVLRKVQRAREEEEEPEVLNKKIGGILGYGNVPK
jgi:hypothetical protein